MSISKIIERLPGKTPAERKKMRENAIRQLDSSDPKKVAVLAEYDEDGSSFTMKPEVTAAFRQLGLKGSG